MEELWNCGDGIGGRKFVRFDFGVEVDFAYEFDAFRYFDFCREETCVEAREAEMWFERNRGYDYSPLVAKGSSGNNFLTENINVYPKLEIISEVNVSSHIERGTITHSGVDEGYKGWSTNNHMDYEYLQPNCKTVFKVPPFKCSTLMKPTASQLAKKNWTREKSRCLIPKPPACNHVDQFQNGEQAPKRQKLEDGQMQKLQKKEDVSMQSRIKPTVLREPELQTARRARLIRLRSYKEQQENVCSTTYVFKARPLNKKILEAPSLPLRKRSIPRPAEFQEFHLETAERAVHHLHATNHSFTSNLLAGAKRVKGLQDQASRHSQLVKLHYSDYNLQNVDENELQRSKARPTRKHFRFSTNKSVQTNPPTDLFDKLSLASGVNQRSLAETIISQPFQSPCKVNRGYKEDNQRIVLAEVHQEHFSTRNLPWGFTPRDWVLELWDSSIKIATKTCTAITPTDQLHPVPP